MDRGLSWNIIYKQYCGIYVWLCLFVLMLFVCFLQIVGYCIKLPDKLFDSFYCTFVSMTDIFQLRLIAPI